MDGGDGIVLFFVQLINNETLDQKVYGKYKCPLSQKKKRKFKANKLYAVQTQNQRVTSESSLSNTLTHTSMHTHSFMSHLSCPK